MTEKALTRLIEMMAMLRSEDKGCPWDKKQTYQSLTPHTLEETHEVIDAIEQQNYDGLKDELGDLLFQVVFYARIASEEERFDLIDIINNLVDKMHRRHPHVFADMQINNEAELSSHWENIKVQEQRTKSNDPAAASALDNVPVSMPALSRAQKLQKRAAKTGFDWVSVTQVLDKVHEELDELEEAIQADKQAEIEHEIGDLIQATVNLARHLNVDAEQALRRANQRFINRFQQLEQHFKTHNRLMANSNLDELEALWQRVKKQTDGH